MGYTHYWYSIEEFNKEAFEAAVEECRKVCEASGVEIVFEYDQTDKDSQFDKDMIRFNGIEDDGHETFSVTRIGNIDNFLERNGKIFEFCKTARKPYDVCVTACLIVLKHHLGDDIEVSSDGYNEEWMEARNLCQKVLGYGQEGIITVDS